MLELPDIVPDIADVNDHANPSKALLYGDPFLGVFDSAVNRHVPIPYGQYAQMLGEAKKRTGEYAYLFATAQALCHLMEIKAYLGVRTRRAYRDGYFRKSICDPLTRENTGDNTPAHLHLDMVAGETVRVTFLPKGFGSENMSRLVMLTPSQGRKGIVDTIVETMKIAGSRPCPPVCVGVGIGGAFDGCAFLAKKALTRDVGSANPREDVASIEREALEKINALNIGAQGFGGKVTALSVACEIAPTHIAGLPVAVNIQCHCVRCEKETL